MKDYIKVIIKNPGRPYAVREIKNELHTLQKIVDGYIETATLFTDAVVICNEEGRLIAMDYNCRISNVAFYGPIIIAGIDGEEFGDVPDSIIERFIGGKNDEEIDSDCAGPVDTDRDRPGA